jgi:hypothetical protein
MRNEGASRRSTSAAEACNHSLARRSGESPFESPSQHATPEEILDKA